MIGKEISRTEVPPGLLLGEGQKLTHHELELLWRIFVEIGRCWGIVHTRDAEHVVRDAANLRSTWLEFIEAKTTVAPSYAAEYSNAVAVVSELIEVYGETNAFTLLFLANGIPEGPPTTRLAHAKVYVVDEFIAVLIAVSGFKEFAGRNHRGYIGGSRFNRATYISSRTGEEEG